MKFMQSIQKKNYLNLKKDAFSLVASKFVTQQQVCVCLFV